MTELLKNEVNERNFLTSTEFLSRYQTSSLLTHLVVHHYFNANASVDKLR